jgi:hypothetical protein
MNLRIRRTPNTLTNRLFRSPVSRFDEETWNDYRKRFPNGQVVETVFAGKRLLNDAEAD